MELTAEDHQSLYHAWMSQKAKMHLTQMEVTRKLGISPVVFHELLRGDRPLTHDFIQEFCQLLHLDPYLVLPSLKASLTKGIETVVLKNRVKVDGEISRVYVEDNEVVIEYVYKNQH
ncbi:MAG: XRE family transcriptional regulator [Vibrio sp.]